ncbi:MAG TPA: zinc-ribbon domain-containing protein, partial [Intrasporangium sp.]|nr:zinc-ribbon domain-containing protein [Intrasporangium sp.]
MPFCTDCGKQNPDDAKFCSRCGHRLVTDEAGQESEPPTESTATITFGAAGQAPERAADTDERPLNPADSAAVDALPRGHALLVVQRGPSAGSRFLLDTELVTAGRHPESEIFLDDVT